MRGWRPNSFFEKRMKALITTIPFGKYDKTSLQALEDNHIEYLINPFDRKIKLSEIDYLENSEYAQKVFSENYVGLPF